MPVPKFESLEAEKVWLDKLLVKCEKDGNRDRRNLHRKKLQKWHQKVWARKNRPSGFYVSREWRKLRAEVFKRHGKKCLNCGSESQITVDHVKPKSLFPDLALNLENLQPLCRACNSLKGNRLETDFRTQEVAS